MRMFVQELCLVSRESKREVHSQPRIVIGISVIVSYGWQPHRIIHTAISKSTNFSEKVLI